MRHDGRLQHRQTTVRDDEERRLVSAYERSVLLRGPGEQRTCRWASLLEPTAWWRRTTAARGERSHPAKHALAIRPRRARQVARRRGRAVAACFMSRNATRAR